MDRADQCPTYLSAFEAGTLNQAISRRVFWAQVVVSVMQALD